MSDELCSSSSSAAEAGDLTALCRFKGQHRRVCMNFYASRQWKTRLISLNGPTFIRSEFLYVFCFLRFGSEYPGTEIEQEVTRSLGIYFVDTRLLQRCPGWPSAINSSTAAAGDARRCPGLSSTSNRWIVSHQHLKPSIDFAVKHRIQFKLCLLVHLAK